VTVYFLRHGIADRQSPDGDRGRKLTAEGKSQLRRVLAFARESRMKPDLVISSPYARATETARIATQELAFGEDLVLADALTPESSATNLWNEVRTHAADSVLVVSHEPLLSSTIAWVLGTSREMIHFPPGALAAIDFASTGPAPSGVLRWMITPEQVPDSV